MWRVLKQLKAGNIAVTCLKIQDKIKNLKSKHRGVYSWYRRDPVRT